VEIDRLQARQLAAERVARFAEQSGLDLVLLDEETLEFDDGWIFSWDSAASVAGDQSDPLAGNAPVVVFRNGTIRHAPTSYATPEKIIDWLRVHPEVGPEKLG
jgi:hypothetical protein